MADVVILTPGVLTGDLIAPAMRLASKDGRVWPPPSPRSTRTK